MNTIPGVSNDSVIRFAVGCNRKALMAVRASQWSRWNDALLSNYESGVTAHQAQCIIAWCEDELQSFGKHSFCPII